MSDELRAKMKRTSPSDAGLSSLDYHKQAHDGVDPLHEFGDVGRDIIRVCAHNPGPQRVSDVMLQCGWTSDTNVRDVADRLVDEDVLEATAVDKQAVEYDVDPAFFERDVWDAHLTWREQADTEVTL